MEFFSDTGYSLHGRQLYEKPSFREPIWQTTRSGFEVEGLVEGLQEHVGFRDSVSEGIYSKAFRRLQHKTQVFTLSMCILAGADDSICQASTSISIR
jgi:hypothetical protein